MVTTANATANEPQQHLVHALQADGRPVVVAAMPNGVDGYLAAYAPRPVTVRSLARVITGEVNPQGRLPDAAIPHHHRMGGGAINRVPPGETAFGHRAARAETWIIGCSGEEPIGPTIDWVRRVWDDIAPHATGGTYVNALDADRSIREAYADEVFERLVTVKRRYDADGVLSGNGIA